MLDLEDRADVTIVRLRHGKVNALDLELLLAITAAMRAVDQARAVVITGSGPAGIPGRRAGPRRRSAAGRHRRRRPARSP